MPSAESASSDAGVSSATQPHRHSPSRQVDVVLHSRIRGALATDLLRRISCSPPHEGSPSACGAIFATVDATLFPGRSRRRFTAMIPRMQPPSLTPSLRSIRGFGSDSPPGASNRSTSSPSRPRSASGDAPRPTAHAQLREGQGRGAAAGRDRQAPAEGTPEHDRLRARGEAALARGELAFCTMAGGMATRMGGIVKALVEASGGHTFLELRLAENRTASARAGRPVPLWLMTSEATTTPSGGAREGRRAGARRAPSGRTSRCASTPTARSSATRTGEPSELRDRARRPRRRAPPERAARSIPRGGRQVRLDHEPRQPRRHRSTRRSSALHRAVDQGIDVQCEVATRRATRAASRCTPKASSRCSRSSGSRGLRPDARCRVFNTNTFLVRAEPLLPSSPSTWT